MTKPDIRTLAKLFGVLHNVTYYARELRVFQDRGIEEFWHGYMAFRAAPMGRVEAPAVTATFYNFAPDLVEAAVPAVWDIVSPVEATELRELAVRQCLADAFAGHDIEQDAADIADYVFAVMAQLSAAGRPLFGAYLALAPPADPTMRLWHAATLWREYRGDGHNIALAAEAIDGIECHVLLAAKGVADQQVIEKIRGWDQPSWEAAHDRLLMRGLVSPDGTMTDSGAHLRRHIEDMTDRLATEPLERLGNARATTVIAKLDPIVRVLVESGVVPDKWPPPKPSMPS